ncbi:MAG: TonB family protein [Bryobacterales bacterium]|nr:TonB family protein [Bryobacterales bacterium]
MIAILFHNLVAHGLQVALTVTGSALLVYVLGLRTAAAKLGYFQLVLVICLALPFVQPWRPLALHEVVNVTPGRPLAAEMLQDAAPRTRALPLAETILVIAVLGILARSLWLTLGFWTLYRYRRTSSAFESCPPSVAQAQQRLGIRAEFRTSDKIKGPITFGLKRPLILLPSGYLAMAAQTQEAIACHELIHVRRHDWVPTVLEELVLSIFWFHPGIWWLIAQIRLAREQVVDREVIAITSSRNEYVEALLEVARLNRGTRLAPATLFIRRRHLLQRAAAITKEYSMSKRRLVASLVAGVCAIVIVGRLGVWLFPLEARAQEQSVQPISVESGEDGLLHWARIDYPRRAMERRVEGVVVLEINIDEHGQVADARVLSGPDELRRAALQSVLLWHYDPAKRPAGKGEVSIHYRLPKEENVTRVAAEQQTSREAELLELRKKSEIAAPGTEAKAFLEKQIAELKSKVQNEGPSNRREMEANLAALRSKKEMAAAGTQTKAFLEKEIAELESRLQSPESAGAGHLSSNISGTLRSIRTERLSPSARSEIVSRLPVHIGDEINQESAKKIREALNTVDQHLTMSWAGDQGNLSLLIGVESDGGDAQGFEFRGAPFEYRSTPAPVK